LVLLLERNVVVVCSCGSNRHEVGGVRCDVAALLRSERLSALAAGVACTIATRIQELDGVGDDLDLRALLPVGLPAAPAKAAIDTDAAALLEVCGQLLEAITKA